MEVARDRQVHRGDAGERRAMSSAHVNAKAL